MSPPQGRPRARVWRLGTLTRSRRGYIAVITSQSVPWAQDERKRTRPVAPGLLPTLPRPAGTGPSDLLDRRPRLLCAVAGAGNAVAAAWLLLPDQARGRLVDHGGPVPPLQARPVAHRRA